MDNKQLVELFNSIITNKNSFDRLLQLKSIKKEYKKSEFYKKTHLSLLKAYEWFVKDSLSTEAMTIKRFTDSQYLGEFLTDLLDNIAPDAVETFVDRIINALNTTELINASTELGEQIQSLKR